MKRNEMIKEFNKVLQELISDGYMFCPHDYSRGIVHEHLIKGNELKRIRLQRYSGWTMHKKDNIDTEVYILSVDTRQLEKKDIKRIIDGDSPWSDSDELYTIKEIKRYYQVGFHNTEWYVDNKEEWLKINDKCKKRSNFNRFYYYGRHNSIILPEKAKEIVLPFMKRQYKCKSIKVSDIQKVEKQFIKGSSKPVRYVVYAKGNTYTLNY